MFKMTERAKAARIRREWECDICSHTWITVHEPDEEDETPECPMGCDSDIEQVRRPVGVKTNASRAVEVTHAMSERMGMTNMRDNLKKGDTSYVAPPPIQTAEAEAMTRAMLAGEKPELGDAMKASVQSFFGAANTGQMARPANQMQAAIQSQVPTNLDAARAMAAPAAQAARGMGKDPIALLHGPTAKQSDPLAKRNLKILSKERPKARG